MEVSLKPHEVELLVQAYNTALKNSDDRIIFFKDFLTELEKPLLQIKNRQRGILCNWIEEQFLDNYNNYMELYDYDFIFKYDEIAQDANLDLFISLYNKFALRKKTLISDRLEKIGELLNADTIYYSCPSSNFRICKAAIRVENKCFTFTGLFPSQFNAGKCTPDLYMHKSSINDLYHQIDKFKNSNERFNLKLINLIEFICRRKNPMLI
jgi:hypothetical protein